jgi:hypothetical protein
MTWLRRRIQAGFLRWWQSRQPASDHLRLTQRNVYILPTRGGWAWAALLLLLLLGAINYQLNLGYLLCFVLAGVAGVSMHSTHATLRGLSLTCLPPEPVHAGETTSLAIHVEPAAGAARPRWGIGLRAAMTSSAGSASPTPEDEGWLWFDLPGAERGGAPDPAPAATTVLLHLPLPARPRGCHALPRLVIETRWPFGLFRAWSWWQPAAEWLVWPAAETPTPPWPAGADPTDEVRPEPLPLRPPPIPEPDSPARPEDPLSPEGVRPYRPGDSPRQIAWRKSATGIAAGLAHPLVSRSGAPAEPPEVHSLTLRWADTAALARRPALAADDLVERRLARLCAWLLAAEASGRPWTLELPDGATPGSEASGQALHTALDRLARFDLGGDTPSAAAGPSQP